MTNIALHMALQVHGVLPNKVHRNLHPRGSSTNTDQIPWETLPLKGVSLVRLYMQYTFPLQLGIPVVCPLVIPKRGASGRLICPQRRLSSSYP